MWGRRGQLLRIISNNLFKAIGVATPLLGPLAVHVPELEWLKDDFLRATIALAVLGLIFVFEGYDLYAAQIKGGDFRAEYMKELTKPIASQLGVDLRLNVMYARRRWYFLWLVRTFEWDDEPLGFTVGRFHRDQKLWLTEWQGLCGEALRASAVGFADLRTRSDRPPSSLPWKNPYNLFPRQIRATTHVKAILCVPMFLKRKAMRPIPIGVINADAVSDKGVEWLTNEWKRWDATGQGELVPKLLAAGSLLAFVS